MDKHIVQQSGFIRVVMPDKDTRGLTATCNWAINSRLFYKRILDTGEAGIEFDVIIVDDPAFSLNEYIERAQQIWDY